MPSSKKRSDDLVLVRTRQALRRLRDEVARELAIDPAKIQDGYWGNLSAREAGAIGGRMVKRMIEAAERSLAAEIEGGGREGSAPSFNGSQAEQTSFRSGPGPGETGKGS
ncbi:MAG: alpha/beta-type small acid-soluble spore protein [Bacillota bacterium]